MSNVKNTNLNLKSTNIKLKNTNLELKSTNLILKKCTYPCNIVFAGQVTHQIKLLQSHSGGYGGGARVD